MNISQSFDFVTDLLNLSLQEGLISYLFYTCILNRNHFFCPNPRFNKHIVTGKNSRESKFKKEQVFQKKKTGRKKNLAEENLAKKNLTKKNLGRKNFWAEKNIGRKNIGQKNNCHDTIHAPVIERRMSQTQSNVGQLSGRASDCGSQESRPCGFGQSLGRPIVQSISPFFLVDKKNLFSLREFLVRL